MVVRYHKLSGWGVRLSNRIEFFQLLELHPRLLPDLSFKKFLLTSFNSLQGDVVQSPWNHLLLRTYNFYKLQIWILPKKKRKKNQSTKFINWWSAKQLISKIVIVHKQTPTLSTYLLLVMLIHSEACEINDLLIVGCCFNLTNTAYCSHCFLRKSDDKAMRKILSCCVFLLSLWSERQGRRTIWIVSIVSCLLKSSSSHTWLGSYLFYPITQRYSSVQFYHVVIQQINNIIIKLSLIIYYGNSWSWFISCSGRE